MLSHAATWQGILEGLYRGLLAVSTSGYQTDGSDAWTQRTDMRREWTPRHLAASFEIGPVAAVKATHIEQQMRLTFACRYRPTDDSESQAIQTAATWAALAWLLDWHTATGCRVLTASTTPQVRDEQFNTVSIDFLLFVPRS